MALLTIWVATHCDDLSLLTTYYRPTERQFDWMNATSAATAQAAWMCAQIQVHYPDAWPETIRGLMVHSAEWTEPMIRHFLKGNAKRDYLNLVRVCGFGVPNLDKALACTRNSLTLISQQSIQPFKRRPSGGDYTTNEMHLHELPWPREALLELGETPITLRVTLSYFIEPGPGEVGWEHRYRYPSHGLRFDLISPNETEDDFIKRINAEARVDGENLDHQADGDRWKIGTRNRHLGSLHSDIWEGTAAEIASCNFIGVYPATGWWKERHHLGKWDEKARYSLIVSLHTPPIEVDLYTPITTMLRIPIET